MKNPMKTKPVDQIDLIRTAARWKIPRELASIVIAREDACVYCRRVFEGASDSRAALPSWEHIVNDVLLVNNGNIALCCLGCNASKGKKSLEDWLRSKYCAERGITKQSMAPVATSAVGVVFAAT